MQKSLFRKYLKITSLYAERAHLQNPAHRGTDFETTEASVNPKKSKT